MKKRPFARSKVAAKSCSGPLGSGAFVGGRDKNSATFTDGAVLGGTGNSVCDQSSGIGAGESNTISLDNAFDPSSDSFIGAGYTNVIYTYSHDELGSTGYSFIGAGAGNSVYANAFDSGVVVGEGNGIVGIDDFIGGGLSNNIYGNEVGGDGGQESAIVAGTGNVIASDTGGNDALVGAGTKNFASGESSFIGAGNSNMVPGFSSAIGAGSGNTASGNGAFIGAGGSSQGGNIASGIDAVIGAGDSNSVGGLAAFIGSGRLNTITPNGAAGGSQGAAYTVIAGGSGNSIISLIPGGGMYGAIGGGHSNRLSAFNGVIGGGYSNLARGDYAVVPGGVLNSAIGVASFAAGRGSQALNDGTFVWSDDAAGATPLKSSGSNQFLIRSAGGIALYSDAKLTSGVVLRPGSGSWASLSDRSSKTHIVALDPSDVLARLERLPVTEWSYEAEQSSIRHIGPMAGDFHATFGIGEDAKHITTVDEDGVALAAIQGLAAELKRKDQEVADLRDAVHKLQASVAALLHERSH